MFTNNFAFCENQNASPSNTFDIVCRMQENVVK